MKEALSHKNHSIDFQSKSMDWFLYDRASVMKELKKTFTKLARNLFDTSQKFEIFTGIKFLEFCKLKFY